MRKILVFLSVLCLVSMLAVSAGAVTGAKTVSSYTTVTADGSCQSTLTVTIHLDAPVEDLTFPLPGEAKNITVNGNRAGSFSQNGLRMVKLPRAVGKTAGLQIMQDHMFCRNRHRQRLDLFDGNPSESTFITSQLLFHP